MFAAGIALVYRLYRLHVINAVLAFWAAYILTRPLGASAGDLLTQAPRHGGLGMGRVPVTGVILVAIIALVVYLSCRSNGSAAGEQHDLRSHDDSGDDAHRMEWQWQQP